MDRKTRITLGTAALALGLCAQADAGNADDWTVALTPYVWATRVGVDVRFDGQTVVDEEISVIDLLEDLDTILQGRVEVQHGAVGMMIDLFDVNLSDDAGNIALPQGAGMADVTSESGMTLIDVAGFYDPKGDRQGFGFLYGARIIDQRATVDAAITTSSGATLDQRHEGDETFVDGLVGVRMTQRIGNRWSIQMQADVSTGDTDLTWSTAPSVSYALSKSGRYALSAGYRHLAIDFDEEKSVDSKMTLSGPVLGFHASF